MPIIKLQSSDNEIFETDMKIAKCSGTIKTMLEDCGIDDDQDGAIVPLPNVDSKILRLILRWAEQHKDDSIPADDGDGKDEEKRSDKIPAWDADFLKVDQATLYEITLAANYLDIKGLLDSSCKTIANMIKGKSAEEIKKTFNIRNDFTLANEEQMEP